MPAPGYDPIDADSAAIVQRRSRWTKIGIVSVVAAAIVVTISVLYHDKNPGVSTVQQASTDPDASFAGLLLDDKGFYFPTTLAKEGGGPTGRRLKEEEETLTESYAQNKVDVWGLDWSSAPEDAQRNYAAIGEYYKAKGMALADYYRSKYDPTYQSSKDATWTYDWQADQQRGIEIGKYYQKIGLAIDDHYHALYDPTYVAPGPAQRFLRSTRKTNSTGATATATAPATDTADATPVPPTTTTAADADADAETVADTANTTTSQHEQDVYNWQVDKDRGMAIGEYYKELGEAIAAHYNQTTPYKDPAGNDVDFEWTSFWDEYRQKGRQIGQYYQQKAQEIKDFYKGKLPDVTMSTKDVPTIPGGASYAPPKTKTSVKAQPSSSTGPYDWQAEKAKGLAIADYYRAKYDPTYGEKPDSSSAPADAVPSSSNPASHGPPPPPAAGPPPGPDVSGIAECEQTFPPWGQDPDADREHGKAIGGCWKQKGKVIGEYYKQHGKELGKYYEDYYRTIFDPTYTSAPPTGGGSTRV